MKPVLLSLAIALLMVGCGDGNVDYEDLEYRNGVMYLPHEEAPFTGRAERFYQNGQKGEESNWKDGLKDGPVTKWFENGQKEEEENWKDGMEDGLWTYWYENGQKREEGNLKDGKSVGLLTKWWKNGQKGSEDNYKDGRQDGLSTWWYKNGQKRQESNWKDGKLMSTVVLKPNGEKCPVTNVKDGTGVKVLYKQDGTELDRWTYKDGEQVYD